MKADHETPGPITRECFTLQKVAVFITPKTPFLPLLK